MKEALRRLRMEESNASYRNEFKKTNHAERVESLKFYFPALTSTKAQFFSHLEHKYTHLFNDDFETFLAAVKVLDDEMAKLPGSFESKKKEFKKEFAQRAREFHEDYEMEGRE